MALRFGFASLIPLGLEVDGVDEGENTLVVMAPSGATTASSPLCGAVSRRVQSHYVRRPSHLPCAGRRVRLRLLVRRFRCSVPGFRREVFAERSTRRCWQNEPGAPDASKRSSTILAWQWGGRPGAGFAQRLMLVVSNHTLLRVARRRALPRSEKLAVIGIDDWAYRRNHRYGTIVCDLERRRVVALLPDWKQGDGRSLAASASRDAHPGISIVSRDRGGGYGEAVARALPDTIQVADR